MVHSFWLSVLFWLWSLSVIYAQADSSYIHVHARLINEDTREVVPFAHILMKSRSMGVITNEDGVFNTRVLLTDTLVLSSIGFLRKEIPATDFMSDSSLRIIKLSPHIYELDEIIITQYPTYERLKEIVTNPELSYKEKMVFRSLDHLYKGTGLRTPNLNFKANRIVPGGFFSPITSIANLFNKERSSLKELEKLEMKDEYRKKVFRRVKVSQIQKLTGLKDSVVIVRFLEFCKFEPFTLKSFTDYELFQLIIEKYKAFRKKY